MIPIMWKFPPKPWFLRGCLELGGWDYLTSQRTQRWSITNKSVYRKKGFAPWKVTWNPTSRLSSLQKMILLWGRFIVGFPSWILWGSIPKMPGYVPMLPTYRSTFGQWLRTMIYSVGDWGPLNVFHTDTPIHRQTARNDWYTDVYGYLLLFWGGLMVRLVCGTVWNGSIY